jgi:hypothetical protein
LVGLSGSIATSPEIVIAGGATFNVSGYAGVSFYMLATGQVLNNSTSTAMINGSLGMSSGILSLTYGADTPSLSITNGEFALYSVMTLTINNTGPPLGAGVYTLISTNMGGSVVGSLPSSFMVTGNGIEGGTTASLLITDATLELVVTPPVPQITGISLNGTILNITATNGADGGQFVLLGSTNLLLPLNQWIPILTNNFDGNGNLNLVTNIINAANPLEFYMIWQ